MSEMSKEFLRNYVKEQNFSNSTEVLTALKSLFKDVLQEALAAELDDMLGYEKNAINSSNNSRNGYSKKTINSELGPITLDIPRDRNGEFEPKIVPKHQRNINGIEDKIISLYAAGMTTRDISEQIKNLYDVEISAETVSNITNRILPLVNEWQNRPLEKTYSLIYGQLFYNKLLY